MLSQLISEYNGEDKFMTRIGVGGLINLDRIHQAELLLNDIGLFHQHAAAAAAASSALDSTNRQTCSDELHSLDITPDTTEQSVSTINNNNNNNSGFMLRIFVKESQTCCMC